MFISYGNDDIRKCCLLLNNANTNSGFTINEIKIIRSIIADLKAAPKLLEIPLRYNFDQEVGLIYIKYGNLKIVCKANSAIHKPTPDSIERIKILQIINDDVEENLASSDIIKL